MDKIQEMEKNLSLLKQDFEKLQKENNVLKTERYINKIEFFKELEKEVEQYFFDYKFKEINNELLFLEKIFTSTMYDIKTILHDKNCPIDCFKIKTFIKNKNLEIKKEMDEIIDEKQMGLKQEIHKKESKYILFIVILCVVIIPIFFEFRWLDFFIK